MSTLQSLETKGKCPVFGKCFGTWSVRRCEGMFGQMSESLSLLGTICGF